jgi:hypothetical protein
MSEQGLLARFEGVQPRGELVEHLVDDFIIGALISHLC